MSSAPSDGRRDHCAELSEELFGSLRRKGQRRKAEEYVRGLLASSGRKTLRNIAGGPEDQAALQRVHHFISTSPWDWMPVREALARYVRRELAPAAWVIRSTVIPKSGPHMIGVDSRVGAARAKSPSGQQAVGTWLGSERGVVPVDWQLCLPERWLVAPLRRRAGIPPEVVAGTVDHCLREALHQVVAFGRAGGEPVVVDCPEAHTVDLVRELLALGLPFLTRIDPTTPLRLDRSALPKFGAGERPAGDLVNAMPQLRRRFESASGLTTAVSVPVTGPGVARSAGMLLTGAWPRDGAGERTLWLSGNGVSSPGAVLGLSRLSAAVARDGTAVSRDVGMCDFTGRSFPGWHHHMTLACVAHLMAVRAGLREAEMNRGPACA
ncbi:IS701 family transposase [Streptomyces pyxinae]|uniref:IS701 family transposase n=1 Tax=Streptomyces pyxinae TaxID=2970734 RepID=UPI003D177A6C